VRSDSRFSGAIDTFDHIQLTMDKLPSKYGNARKYLNGLKEKLPAGTPYGQRSLPPDTNPNDYHVYCQRAVKTSQGWANENQPL
jgi:hypothetical protein